ncbi:MAG: DUF4394 domain-containing protein [Acidobacteriota bacterium]|nr:DUF4394 domain-containing protein [Acidobacteriota bacterium]
MLKRTLVLALTFVTMMFAAVGQATAEPLVALASTFPPTPNSVLIRFDSATPGTVQQRAVTGLQQGELLLGIDIRPANGLLYGVTNQNRLYVVDPLTGVAVFALSLSTPVGVSGIDFDPVTDRLRVVSGDDRNVRINVDTGEVSVNGSINPSNSIIEGSAYTNNFAGATATTLYGIDRGRFAPFLVIQDPTRGTVTDVGLQPFPFNIAGPVGFDISGQTGIAYAAMSTSVALNALFTINLATGQATLVGQIGTGMGFSIAGLAVPVGTTVTPPPSAIPEPTTMILLGTGLAGVAAKVRRRRKD